MHQEPQLQQTPLQQIKKMAAKKKRKSLDPNKKKSILIKNAKMPSLTAVAKKNVTGVKIPSYTSGVQA